MKTISLKKSMAMVLALAMALALCVVPAFAAETQYTAVAGTSTTFQKALILDENANVPSVTFQYSIAPGTAIAAVPGTSVEVISPSAATGVTGTPSIADITYAPGDATVTSATGVTIDAGEKAALKTATVDFSGVTFAEPGIYRYIVTETSAGQQGMSYDTQLDNANGVSKQRVLDVYVTDNGSGSLAVSSYVFHEEVSTIDASADLGSGEVAANGDAVADKSVGYVNEYATYDLTISKTVAGNQASRDKYFKFTVAITNAGANVDLDVDMSNAAVAPTKSSSTIYEAAVMATANGADDDNAVNGQQWRTAADGSVTKDIYLQHGQSVVIKGLAAGATYTITEVPEDYKCNQANNQIADTTGMADDATAAFTNTKSGMVPTGVVLSAIPGVALIGIGGGFAIATARKNKKEED
jgi:hypothetical protein